MQKASDFRHAPEYPYKWNEHSFLGHPETICLKDNVAMIIFDAEHPRSVLDDAELGSWSLYLRCPVCGIEVFER